MSIILCQRCTKLLWLFVIICIKASQVTCQFANIADNRHYLKQHRSDQQEYWIFFLTSFFSMFLSFLSCTLLYYFGNGFFYTHFLTHRQYLQLIKPQNSDNQLSPGHQQSGSLTTPSRIKQKESAHVKLITRLTCASLSISTMFYSNALLSM